MNSVRIELEPGFRININSEGAAHGPAIVLLHGFTGSAAAWGHFGERLATACQIVSVDIVGHGASDSPATVDHYRMVLAVEDVVAAVAAVGFQRATWLGYSMGGRLALHVAVAHPEAVERLVLIGASPGIERESERLERVHADELLADQIERDGVEAFIDYWERVPLFTSQRHLPPAVRDTIRAGRLKNRARGLANSLRGMGAGAQEPLHGRLQELCLPALLLAGESDAKYVAIAAAMGEAIPGARAIVIPGAGHAAHIEQPDRCADEVLAFFAAAGHAQQQQGATT